MDLFKEPKIKGSYLQFLRSNFYLFESLGIDNKKIASRILLLPQEIEKNGYYNFKSFLYYAQNLYTKELALHHNPTYKYIKDIIDDIDEL